MKLLITSAIALMLTTGVVANQARAQNTIADIVAASGGDFDQNYLDYDLLLTAVQTAGLVDALADENADLTVFAPNDLAFVRTARDLGYDGIDEAGAWSFLVAALTDLGGGDPIPVLTDILLYHVVPESLNVVDFFIASLFSQPITTLLGADFTPFFVLLKDNDPDIPDARLFLLALNIEASNGIIHTIGRVMIPLDI